MINQRELHRRSALGERLPVPSGTAGADSHGCARRGGQGRVSIVGAGPGGADHLTLKALRLMQGCDAVLFDDLVPAEVLALVRPGARLLPVGKRARRESCRQEDINALMVSLARRGLHVVRLKSGDPTVFGRAGEELQHLAAAGIPAEVVPGISTAFALAAELGQSLTHRDHAQSLRLVTAHGRNGALPESLDLRALADPATTHVYYMVRRTLPELRARLLAHGLPADTPAVIASAIGRPEQRIWRGDVAGLAAAIEDFPFDQPTVAAIGRALGAPGGHAAIHATSAVFGAVAPGDAELTEMKYESFAS